MLLCNDYWFLCFVAGFPVQSSVLFGLCLFVSLESCIYILYCPLYFIIPPPGCFLSICSFSWRFGPDFPCSKLHKIFIQMKTTYHTKLAHWCLHVRGLSTARQHSTALVIIIIIEKVYSDLVIYWHRVAFRILAEFQSRKAHRVEIRDKDLVVYLCGIVVVVVGYMAAWTAVTMDNLKDGDSMMEIGMTADQRRYESCITHWWNYVIETGAWRHNGTVHSPRYQTRVHQETSK